MAATTAASFPWERPSLAPHSPDTASSVYPDRPIRPLPKRRLRSRLSSEQADAISYPPVPPSSSPLYGSPQSQSDRSFMDPRYPRDANGIMEEHDHVCECGEHHAGMDSEEEDDEREASSHSYSWSGRTMKYPRERAADHPYQPPPPNSSTSSADGYESFENTNNKKKRKIPISGGLNSHSSTGLDSPSQSLDVSYSEATRVNGVPHNAPASGMGLSGPGRGRYSRSTGRMYTERRPLANTYANGGFSDKGIISTAMENAKGPALSATNGQENVSLLQKHKQSRDGSQSFTFECKSDSSDKMAMSRSPLPPAVPQGPLTSGPARGKAGPHIGPPGSSAAQPHYSNQNSGPEPAPKLKATKKEVFDKQARHRKKKQQIENYHNPLGNDKPEDQWMCYMCEYEGWFGESPKLFMRRYEAKDHAQRKAKREALKRLEQAKAKSRKGKKGKNGTKSSNAATANHHGHAHSQPYDPANEYPLQDEGSQNDEFFEDDYDDDSLPPSTPMELRDSYTANQTNSYPPHGGTSNGFHGLDRTQSLPNL